MKTPDKSPLERISFQHIFRQLLQVLNLEKGLGYTVKWLVINPHKAIYEYLYENRNRMIKPFAFVVLVAAVATYLTVTFIFKGDDLLQQLHADPDWDTVPERLQLVIERLMIMTQKYFNLSYLSSIPFIALATFWVFKEDGLNFAEHLVINCYLYCMQSIILILMIPALALWAETGLVSAGLLLGYQVYAYSRIFEVGWLEGLGKTLLVQVVTAVFSAIILTIFALVVFNQA